MECHNVHKYDIMVGRHDVHKYNIAMGCHNVHKYKVMMGRHDVHKYNIAMGCHNVHKYNIMMGRHNLPFRKKANIPDNYGKTEWQVAKSGPKPQSNLYSGQVLFIRAASHLEETGKEQTNKREGEGMTLTLNNNVTQRVIQRLTWQLQSRFDVSSSWRLKHRSMTGRLLPVEFFRKLLLFSFDIEFIYNSALQSGLCPYLSLSSFSQHLKCKIFCIFTFDRTYWFHSCVLVCLWFSVHKCTGTTYWWPGLPTQCKCKIMTKT